MAPLLSYLTLLLLLTPFIHAIAIEPNSPRTEELYNPLGISTRTPRLSWRLTSSTRGDDQSAYQIQVFSTAAKLAAGAAGDMWDSGKVSGNAISAVYAGVGIKSRDTAWWRVRAWDKSGAAGAWSTAATFEVGLLAAADWKASWIANRAYKMGTNSLPLFAEPFSIACPVAKGRLYLLGLGLHAGSLNGKSVTAEVLAPGYETVAKTLAYSSYDVTGLLAVGQNVLGVELGKSEYDAEAALGGRYMKWTEPAVQLKLVAQLEYTCADGTVHVVVSDGTWVTSTNGPLIESSWYGGEEYDARKEISNWNSPSGNRSGWVNASVTTAPGGALVGARAPGLVVTQTLDAKSITQVGGSWIVDMGVNIMGWYSLSVTGAPGTRIIIHPGELLKSSGLVQFYPNVPVWDAYTIGASGKGTYTQKFMYHGFRYLQIDGLATKPVSVKGLVIRTNNDAVGTFSCSNTLFNQIHALIDRALQGNMASVMTDCPTREKLGWLEQTHLVYSPLSFGYDVHAFLRQTVHLMSDAQLDTGLVPDNVPEFTIFGGAFRDDPNWGNAAMIIPLQLYRTYGDLDILSQNYGMMQRYLNYLTSKSSGYLLSSSLGDWNAFDNTTPRGVTATFGYQQAASAMIAVATALGKTGDAATYKALEQNIRTAFHAKYYDATTKQYTPNTQATNAMALDMNAVPTALQPTILANLVSLVKNNGSHVSVGEIALPSLIRALQAGGQDALLYTMMTQTSSPSYGFQITHGATALTENWDGPVSGNSQNHFMLGYGDVWVVGLAGVAQGAGDVGWVNVTYKPVIVGSLTSVKSTYRSPRGAVSASWSKASSGVVTYDIQVPVGAQGTVYLPGTTNAKEGGAAIAGRPAVQSVKVSGGQTVVVVGSGSYSFSVG